MLQERYSQIRRAQRIKDRTRCVPAEHDQLGCRTQAHTVTWPPDPGPVSWDVGFATVARKRSLNVSAQRHRSPAAKRGRPRNN